MKEYCIELVYRLDNRRLKKDYVIAVSDRYGVFLVADPRRTFRTGDTHSSWEYGFRVKSLKNSIVQGQP